MTIVCRIVVAATFIAAGISYSSWVLEFVLHTGLDPTTSFLSQLDAIGHPYRSIFDIADTVAGVLLVLASVAGRCLSAMADGSAPRYSFAFLALAVFGAATVADAQLPLGCVPTATHLCSSQPRGLFPQLSNAHALTSTVAVNAFFLAMLAFTVTAFRHHRLPLLQNWGVGLLLTFSVSTAWLLVADNLPGDHALGIAQRIQVGAMSLWLVVLGIALGMTAIGAESGRAPERDAVYPSRAGTNQAR